MFCKNGVSDFEYPKAACGGPKLYFIYKYFSVYMLTAVLCIFSAGKEISEESDEAGSILGQPSST